jgi:hypothetical protein
MFSPPFANEFHNLTYIIAYHGSTTQDQGGAQYRWDNTIDAPYGLRPCQYHYRAKRGAQYRWDNTIDAPYRFAHASSITALSAVHSIDGTTPSMHRIASRCQYDQRSVVPVRPGTGRGRTWKNASSGLRRASSGFAGQ